MILVAPRGSKTAKALAQKLDCEKITCKGDCFDCKADGECDIINYGGNCVQADFNRNIVHDKLGAYKIMEAAGIPQPRMWDDWNKIDLFPVLGRKRHHSRGRDIIFCETEWDCDNCESDFYTQYIDKKSEYRVHVLGDKCLCRAKVEDEEMETDPMIRNREKGWKQILYTGIYRSRIKDLARKAVKALGYDFGAVDIIRDQDNNLLVLEVNSAASLNDYKLEIYGRYFKGE